MTGASASVGLFSTSYGPVCFGYGPGATFLELECTERPVSHPESYSKISNLMITELFLFPYP